MQVGQHATLAAMHPNSARVAPDDDGLLPEWLAYHSLVATARAFLVKVCLITVGGMDGMTWTWSCLPGVHSNYLYTHACALLDCIFATGPDCYEQVCPVEGPWVAAILQKLRGIDVRRLSGGADQPPEPATAPSGSGAAFVGANPALQGSKKTDQAALEAARARFAARKAARKK